MRRASSESIAVALINLVSEELEMPLRRSDIDPEEEQQFTGDKNQESTSGTACAKATCFVNH